MKKLSTDAQNENRIMVKLPSPTAFALMSPTFQKAIAEQYKQKAKPMAKTRIKKNYVVKWVGPRGGEKEQKFFTREGADKHALFLKTAKIKGVKVRRQTAFKPNIKM